MLYPIYNTEEKRVEWVTDDLDTAYETAVGLRYLPTYAEFARCAENHTPMWVHHVDDMLE